MTIGNKSGRELNTNKQSKCKTWKHSEETEKWKQQSKVSLFDINKLALNPSCIFFFNCATLQKVASSNAYHNLIIKNRDHQTLFWVIKA